MDFFSETSSDKFKKKVDDAGKLSPAHSENDDKNSYKVIDGEDIQSLAIKEENLKKVHVLKRNAILLILNKHYLINIRL
jgi:hypothetical protein